jgi:hypothetical protein
MRFVRLFGKSTAWHIHTSQCRSEIVRLHPISPLNKRIYAPITSLAPVLLLLTGCARPDVFPKSSEAP